ncbi:MAG: tRNA (guanine(46)-N(7))-methyltransferase TrmB [Niveispirillum sp.]|uniref:tRNA (guanine(46)-N(7))-methyltransferase TrmB n=1 Tax=Niveispirillum sp. TaxID=1917217 RepID=UPI003BA7EF29
MSDDSIPHRKVLYGRRHGRPLRKHRQEVMETLLPKMKLSAPTDGAMLEPATLFDAPKRDLWFEVGFGGGEHLAWQAEHHPDIGFIGCEPFVNGVSSLLKHVQAGGQTNIRVVPDDARPILDTLPDASVGRAFVLFPDPWPKARHAFRRFIGPVNLPRLSRVLKDGAELRIASDDPQLQRWMLEHTWRHPDFEWTARTAQDWRIRPDDWPQTRYEMKALEAGRVPMFLRFMRKNRST